MDVRSEHTDYVWKDEVFPKAAFSGTNSFIRRLTKGSWIWLGTDAQIRRLEAHLMRQIEEQGIPRTAGTSSIGRHGDVWVYEHGTFDHAATLEVATAPYWYAKPNDDQGFRFSYPAPGRDHDDLVRRVYELLPRVNTPEVIWPVIGWFFAAPMKPILGRQGLRFPILQMYGSRGSGKTTLQNEIMFPMFGGSLDESSVALDSQTTPFALIRAMSYSTSVPLALSEFRASQRNADDLLRYLRLTYDSGRATRGRADQTVASYKLTVPVVIDGEDAIDDSAVNERSILIHMRPETLRDQDCVRAYEELASLPLHLFARNYIQYTLDKDAGIQDLVEQWRTRLAKMFGSQLPPRVFESYARVMVGLQLYADYGSLFAAEVPSLTPKYVRAAFTTTTDSLIRSSDASTGALR
ncbi:hypothetical protein LCGC14_2644080, partial [marine sediment metagenome]